EYDGTGPVVEPICAPLRRMSYPVTPTLSSDARQLRSTRAPVTLAVTFVGVVGADASAGVPLHCSEPESRIAPDVFTNRNAAPLGFISRRSAPKSEPFEATTRGSLAMNPCVPCP